MNRFYIKKSYPINVLLMYSSRPILLPKKYILKVSLYTEDENFDMDKVSLSHNISYETMEFFVREILHNSVVIDVGGIQAGDEFVTQYYENNVIVMPSIGEGTLVACLHTKLNTIIDELTTIEEIELYDTDLELSHILDLEDTDLTMLPKQEDWLGGYPFWDTAWWNRTDCSTYDNFSSTKKEDTAWKKTKKKDKLDETFSAPLIAIRDSLKQEYAGPAAEVITVDFKKEKKWTPKVV